MATLTELYNLRSDSALQNRITQACVIAAQEVVAEAEATVNHANRVKWAVAVLTSPDSCGAIMLRLLVAKFNAMTITQLTGAADSSLLNAVKESVNTFANNLG